jgi:hypothetical protein
MTDEVPPHTYDWMLGEPIHQVVEVPIPPDMKPGANATLRVEIIARARVHPTRGWSIAIIVWALLVLLLLHRAHGATWEDQNAQRRAPAWGSWESAHGPDWGTTKHFTVEQGGQTTRCSVWDWRGEQHVRCGE